MKLSEAIKQTLTGADNSTLAIGRVMGAVLFILFLIALPAVSIYTIHDKSIASSDWEMVYKTIPNYVLMLCAGIASLIGFTHFAEPKPKDDDGAH